jgi:release factor glutamine methyltransferase
MCQRTRLPAAQLFAVDLNPEAVELSRENAERLGVAARAEFVVGDALSVKLPVCDLLVANPPYVPGAMIDGLEPEVREHDPRLALDGGHDGMDFVRAMMEPAVSALRSRGWIALEHGDDQGELVPDVLTDSGFTEVRDLQDLSGRPRVAVGRKV